MADRLAEPRACTNCGATAARLEARYCEYCGTELPAPGSEPPPSPFGDVAGRFRALESHPDLPRLLAATPSTSALSGWNAMTVVTLVVFALVGLFVTGGFLFVCPPFALLPLFLVGIGIYTISKQVGKTTSASRAPLERRPALVVRERTKVSGGGEHSSARTDYFATLQFPDGSRREFDVLEGVGGTIAPGDMGVGYLKGDFLIAFSRVGV